MQKMDKQFWMDTLERIIYTMAETALGVLGGSALITEVDWAMVLSSAGIAGLVTLLKCIMLGTKKESTNE